MRKKKKAEKPPPEGAEVKIVGEELAQIVSGKELSQVLPLTGRYLKKPIDGYISNELLWPQRIAGVGVKGKLIYWIFDNGMFLFNTLGMTGSWSRSVQKHSRVKFSFEDGTSVFFNDIRNFGTLKFVFGKKNFLKKISSLGPDMLSEDVSFDLFKGRLLLHIDKTLPEVLMNQSVICGVGNYVKAEALYRSKLSPHRTVLSLSDEDFFNLSESIKDVLKSAYRDQGASIKDYKKVDGSQGSASLQFKVYGKKLDPDGKKIIKEETLDGRTTHWCPDVQI